MLELQTDELNEILIFDKPSGTSILFYYEDITTSERIKYRSELVTGYVKSKDPDTLSNIQIKYAEMKIVGVRDGDLSVKGKPISTNPDKPNYYKDWMKLVKEKAGHLLITFADHLFDSPSMVLKDDKDFFSLKNSVDLKTPGAKKKGKRT